MPCNLLSKQNNQSFLARLQARCSPVWVRCGLVLAGAVNSHIRFKRFNVADHREWPVGACSGWQDDGPPDRYTHRQAIVIYSQFVQLTIRPSNQLAPLKYRASWYPVLNAKLLAAIY